MSLPAFQLFQRGFCFGAGEEESLSEIKISGDVSSKISLWIFKDEYDMIRPNFDALNFSYKQLFPANDKYCIPSIQG